MILNPEERLRVLDKLEKLLSHTGDGAVNVNEIVIAQKKMKELMDKYEISIDEIKATKNGETLVLKTDVNTGSQAPEYWVRSLAEIIARSYECRCIRVGGKFYFIGFEMDSTVVSRMFKKIYAQIYKGARIMVMNSRRDFCMGVITELKFRLDEIKKERERNSNVSALVLIKKGVVDEQVKKMFPNLRKGNGFKYHHSDDFLRGMEFGKTIQIHDEVRE